MFSFKKIKEQKNQKEYILQRLKQENIEETLKWLYEYLGLSDIPVETLNQELDFVKFREYKCFSGRQNHCFISTIMKCNDKNIVGAYHEFWDFIHNYGEGLDVMFTDIEKRAIKVMIEKMLETI